jgi:aryl-alcohol dehydrogenase-like predicted oxidoreductase
MMPSQETAREEAVMKYRKLGNTDIEVPVVIFGAWAIGGWYWGGADDKVSTAAIEKALDVGMNCFDTAPGYGNGHSEKVLGRALKGKRNEAIIATKCGLRWDDSEGHFFFEATDSSGNVRRIYRNLSRDSIRYECEQSLKRLQTDVIDLYQCHWPDETTPLEETMEALIKLKKDGKIRAIGVSNFTTEMMEECLKFDDIASDQPKYNLLRRDIEKDVLPFCRERNIGVISYGPIAQGLLTGKVAMDRKFHKDDLREKFQVWFKPANRKRVVDILPNMKPVADKYGVTLAQLAINWVIGEPGITSAIAGARNPEQVAENAKAGDFELSQEDRALLRKEFEALGPPLE